MKKLILFIAFIGVVLSVNAQKVCDTLKWKTLGTVYGEIIGGSYRPIGELDGAVIDINDFPVLSPGISVANISDDTFSLNEKYTILLFCSAYADTGLLDMAAIGYDFTLPAAVFPDDAIGIVAIRTVELLNLINRIINVRGVDFGEISYWELIIGIAATGKDGNYSERVFYEGADTVTFFVVNYTDMQEIAFDAEDISVFPNPAQTQFTVTHTENAIITLYNLVGQKVRQLPGKEENTIICTEDLPQGVYLLKVEKENAVLTKKVQIIR
jgi:hypothetical protein